LLNVNTKSFVKCCGLSLKRSEGFDATYHNGLVFVISSSDLSSLASIETFNCIENTWSTIPPLPKKISYTSCVSHGGDLYILGGYDTSISSKSSSIIKFNCHDYTWQILSITLSVGRSHHAAASFRECIWVAGGILHTPEVLSSDTTEFFNPVSGTVVQGPRMNRRRYQPRLLTLQSKQINYNSSFNYDLYVIGGDMNMTSHDMGTIDRLDMETFSWVFVTTFPTNRLKCAVCALNDHTICLFGGVDGATILHSYDCYDILTGLWTTTMSSPIAGRANGLKSSVAVQISPSQRIRL